MVNPDVIDVDGGTRLHAVVALSDRDSEQVKSSPKNTSIQPVDLSVVIPTFNERGNLGELIKRIAVALEGIPWEVIIVDDDSPDGTAAEARLMYRSDPRVRCIRRLGRCGLSSACIEGMLASSAEFLAVMDADLQHDPSVLRSMYELLAADEADLVVGSRYVKGLLTFYLICGVGAKANVGVSSQIGGQDTPWALAALPGIFMSAVWNYEVSARNTWKTRS